MLLTCHLSRLLAVSTRRLSRDAAAGEAMCSPTAGSDEGTAPPPHGRIRPRRLACTHTLSFASHQAGTEYPQ